MNDKELMDMIERSAEDIEVPERLRPENIAQLTGQSQKKTADITPIESVKTKKRIPWRRITSMAAVAALAIIAIPVGLRYANSGISDIAPTATDSMVASVSPDSTGTDTDSETTVSEEDAAASAETLKKAFGGYFYLGKDLEEVREAISNREARGIYTFGGGLVRNGATAKESASDVEEATDFATAESDAAAPTDGATGSTNGSYSTTNLREIDVDEGDIVKTDGKYIYIFKEFGEVKIVDIQSKKMSVASSFDPEFDTADDAHFTDLFIRDNMLFLVAETYSVDYSTDVYELPHKDQLPDVDYTLRDSTRTVVLSYDISDRANPRKTGEFYTEGSYQTARISGDHIYLFTWYHGGDIPIVADALPRTDSIYLPHERNYGSTFTMNSISVNDLSKAVDTKVIYSSANDVYVTGDTIIVEISDYDTREKTNLFRFSYENGRFTPAGVGAVPGSLESSFSIDEDSEGRIRVATTSYGYSSFSSGVYVFDRSMKRIGKLTGLAKGETIQSARFLDNVLYLVTYENRDPLFTIDLSDPTKPTVIGKLKLPGFSDYLHFWDDTHLLGIGYDTDENTGEVYGAKLSMFDISDPTDVKEVATTTIKGVDHMPGMYNYKALLVNPERNLIGFGTLSWNEDDDWNEVNKYELFSYDDKKFSELLSEKTTKNIDVSGTRGIFSGDTFYIVDESRIRSYDMNNHYSNIEKLSLE